MNRGDLGIRASQPLILIPGLVPGHLLLDAASSLFGWYTSCVRRTASTIEAIWREIVSFAGYGFAPIRRVDFLELLSEWIVRNVGVEMDLDG